jgi:hypothetical protein
LGVFDSRNKVDERLLDHVVFIMSREICVEVVESLGKM